LAADPVLDKTWLVVAHESQLETQNPLGVRVLGQDLVIWKTSGGQAQVWSDLCLHRGTRLSKGEIVDDCIKCPYHGWVYDDSGQCVLYPAEPQRTPTKKSRAQTFAVAQKYGWVWVCLDEPGNPIPHFPEWDDDTLMKAHCGPYPVSASFPRVIENFLDFTHFPFVHGGFLGDPAHAEVDDFTVEIREDGLTAENITIWQPNPDGTGKGGHVTYTYNLLAPHIAHFVKVSHSPFAMLFTTTPVSETESVAWMYVAMKKELATEEEARSFQDLIFSQDQPIVESQRPELLPLDLSAELHLKSDKVAIEYRRWLRKLGLTFGTA
jgi:phenylpropionate dioxygenase-like ring-hydroxylating dioxygenase large terminal subunit